MTVLCCVCFVRKDAIEDDDNNNDNVTHDHDENNILDSESLK